MAVPVRPRVHSIIKHILQAARRGETIDMQPIVTYRDAAEFLDMAEAKWAPIYISLNKKEHHDSYVNAYMEAVNETYCLDVDEMSAHINLHRLSSYMEEAVAAMMKELCMAKIYLLAETHPVLCSVMVNLLLKPIENCGLDAFVKEQCKQRLLEQVERAMEQEQSARGKRKRVEEDDYMAEKRHKAQRFLEQGELEQRAMEQECSSAGKRKRYDDDGDMSEKRRKLGY